MVGRSLLGHELWTGILLVSFPPERHKCFTSMVEAMTEKGQLQIELMGFCTGGTLLCCKETFKGYTFI